MDPLTPQQFKRMLVEQGFEIFRTKGDEITLAERVRDNLIMDSGVRVRCSVPLEVRVVLRAQRTDFPSEDESALFDGVRRLAAPATEAGFEEVTTVVVPVRDPVDAERTLDTHYEVMFRRVVFELAAVVETIRFALVLEKTLVPRRLQST